MIVTLPRLESKSMDGCCCAEGWLQRVAALDAHSLQLTHIRVGRPATDEWEVHGMVALHAQGQRTIRDVQSSDSQCESGAVQGGHPPCPLFVSVCR